MFTNEKITQAAAYLLKKAGGTLNYTAFIKLLYMADREMLLKWGVPMTYDSWCAMPHGPVLSTTLDLIKADPTQSGFWGKHVHRKGYDITLVAEPGDGLMSEAEELAMDEVFFEYGGMNFGELIKVTHNAEMFPEWSDPDGSSILMTYQHVMGVHHVPTETINQVVANIEHAKWLASIALSEPAVIG